MFACLKHGGTTSEFLLGFPTVTRKQAVTALEEAEGFYKIPNPAALQLALEGIKPGQWIYTQ